MKSESLADLYEDQLKDLYSAEKQLIRALPRMAKAVSSPELKEAIERHLTQTEGHAERLEMLFAQLGMEPKARLCEAMQGLIEEGEEAIKAHEEGPVRDTAIIAAAQRVEHYEMAGYGTLRTFATHLGRESAVDLLQQTLDEEAAAEAKLAEIAESGVNAQAVEAFD